MSLTRVTERMLSTELRGDLNAFRGNLDFSQETRDALESALDGLRKGAANPLDYGAVRGPRTLLEEHGTVEAARAALPTIYIEDGQESVDWAAIQSAVATGRRVYIPEGDYYVNTEIEIVNAGQVIEFASTGGYGYGEDIGLRWESSPTANTRIIAGVGRTVPQRLRTRRLWKGSSSDGITETPLSTIINVQAEGVHLIRPCVWLRTNYSSDSDYGYYIHCAIFVGTRVGTQIHDPIIIGYFRRAGIYIDVSGHSSLPRFSSRAGEEYPSGTVKNGADGTHIYNPYIRGPRIGLGVLGALPKGGASGYSDSYYDVQSGKTVSDSRGSFGCSDFLVVGGRIYGPDFHTNRRVSNPVSSTLSKTSLESEPDDAAAAVYLSGLAGNASGFIWGMRFIGTRIATFEAFRLRLHCAARVSLYDAHIEGRNGGRMDAQGNAIDTNNYSTTSYGDIAASSLVRDVLWHGSARQTPTDGAFNHYYGSSATLVTDSGRHFTAESSYMQSMSGELDLRGAPNSSVRLRRGTDTIALFNDSQCQLVGAGASTVGSTANAYLTSAGTLSRSTSARKYKCNIEPLAQDLIDKIMTLDGITYYPSELTSDPDKGRRFIGMIADDADSLGLQELVHYNEETGEVEGFMYDRVVAAHQMVIRELMNRVSALEARDQEVSSDVVHE